MGYKYEEEYKLPQFSPNHQPLVCPSYARVSALGNLGTGQPYSFSGGQILSFSGGGGGSGGHPEHYGGHSEGQHHLSLRVLADQKEAVGAWSKSHSQHYGVETEDVEDQGEWRLFGVARGELTHHNEPLTSIIVQVDNSTYLINKK